MVQVIDFLAVRQRQPCSHLNLRLCPILQGTGGNQRSCLIASKAFQRSTTCGVREAKRILPEAAHSIAAIGNRYAVDEICDLAIRLQAKSDQIRLPRREVRKITDIPMGPVE
jgi:hypothetical protein